MPSSKEGLLDARDREILRASTPSRRRWSPRRSDEIDGGAGNSPPRNTKWSPTSRWSPSRLSPSSRKQYDALHGARRGELEVEEDNENDMLKSNSVPTTPRFAGGTPPKPADYQVPDLPSPSARARFTITSLARDGALRAKSLSPPSSNQQQLREESIFRFRLQTSGQGTEAILPGYSKQEGRNDSEEDDFDILVKERLESSTIKQKKKTEVSDQEEFQLPPSLEVPPPSSSARKAKASSANRSQQQNKKPLHDLCANMSTLDDLLRVQQHLHGKPETATLVDQHGRTPLHMFASNKILAMKIAAPDYIDQETREYLQIQEQPTNEVENSQLEKLVLRFLVADLIPAHPGAIMVRDEQGNVPFEKALSEWVQVSHQRGVSNGVTGGGGASTFSYGTAINSVWESTAKIARRTSSALTGGFTTVTESPTSKSAYHMERGDSRSAIFSPDQRRQHESDPPAAGIEDLRDEAFPAHVSLTHQARFTFLMASVALDHLERYQKTSSVGNSRRTAFQQQYGSVNAVVDVVGTLAAIPNLMSTIMLIDNDVDREFVLSTALAQRIMTSQRSVGPWLTKMLQSRDRKLAQRAVDYLKAVSDELTKPKLSSKGTSRGKDASTETFHREKLVVDEVSRLHDFIPSLLALNERGIEDASTTFIVKQVLGRMISRPFAVTVILCDIIFLGILITGFRYAVNKMIAGAPLATVLQWIYIANMGIFYFLIRELAKTVSLFQISTRARIYFLSFWNLIDAVAVVMALVSTIVMRSYFTILEKGMDDTSFLRGLLAVTTGLLWLRVLSLLKAINVQLATLVLAILQIAKDILWFCVILATLVVCFSQMFFTLLAPASCASSGDTDEMMCKPTEYLLRVYSILLGDFGNFEREQFLTGFSVFLVVVYSFLVTVVLLNVLIAVASDSYEKCLLRSQHLFGRARVMLIAELVAFQNLLQTTDGRPPRTKPGIYSRWKSSGRWIRHWSRASILFFSISVFVIGAWTIAELVGYSQGERHANILFSLASVFVNVGLFVAIMVFLAASTASSDSREPPTSGGGPISRAMLRILGVSRGSDTHENKSQWNGRVDYLESQMRRIAAEQKSEMNQQVKTVENFVHQSEMRLKADLELMEDNFSLLREALVDEFKNSKQTNQFVSDAVRELKNMMSTATSSTEYQPAPPVPAEVNVSRINFRSFNATERRDS